MKNKVLSTFMATAITATLVFPVLPANAAFSDSSVNHSIQIGQLVAASKTKVPLGQTVTITNITKDIVRTSNGSFKINKSLKSLFDTSNSTALKNAQAKIVVKNGEITSVTALTLNTEGTNKKAVYFDGGDAKISGSLTVNADYLKVTNVNIENELIVSNRVKKSITINDVAVGETIKFKPLVTGKVNWLYVSLQDVKYSKINLNRTKVNVFSDQTISKVDVEGKVTAFEVAANIDKLTINVEDNFSLYGEGKIDKVIVKSGAKVALDSGHLINNVQVDDKSASVILPVANKEELNKLITSPPYVAVSIYGNDILTTEKWTAQTDRTTFENEVISARAIANNASASQAQVNNAITQYKNALAVYQAVQKSGTKYGYGDKSSLQSLIYSVQYVTVSWDGYNVPYNTPWTTQSEKDALVSVVSSAQTVVNNYYSSQNDIANAMNYLNNAIWTYKNAYKYGAYGYYVDKTQLSNLISSAWTEYYSKEYYKSQTAKDALTSAIYSAQIVADNNNSTQSEVTNATEILNNAIWYYQNYNY